MATVSKYLSLKTTNSSLGRYWIANQDIPSGTLLISESPIACVPNCQIKDHEVKDPIINKANSFCWNCCSLFPSTAASDNNHYCSTQCKAASSGIIDILLNPSLPFNQSIANESTLRLTAFMILKMVHYCIQNKQLSLLSNIDATFKTFAETPSKFYTIFAPNLHTTHTPPLLLQHTMHQRMDSNELYQSYLSKLSTLIPSLLHHLQTTHHPMELDINEKNLHQLSTHVLNIVFINAFGIRYSVVHDADMLGLCIFQHTSLFNHSCSPNAFYHFTSGNQIIVRTLRAIAKHESITISIVNDLESHSKAERQRMLSTHFGFECICSRCVEDEYVNNDELLTERMTQTECIVNDKQHQNLLNFARSNWNNATLSSHTIHNAWKFYKRLWNEYRYHYHPFDPDVLSLLEELSQKAFMIKDYQIGYDAAELGREFAVRLASCNIMDNCHLTEFKFIFLSFLNYLHLMKSEYPKEDIEKIMNVNVKDTNKDIVVMNDDILAKMFEDDTVGSDQEETMEDVKRSEMVLVEENKTDTKENVKKKDKAQGAKTNNNNNKKNKKKSKHNRNNHHRKQRQNVSSKGKKTDGKRKRKRKGNHGSKRNHKKGNKCNVSKDKNVTVFTFGANKGDNVERKEEEEDEEEYMENALEYELNEKIIELFATRSILFPTFEDFELWIGRDVLRLDQRIQNVVTSLKDKFDENV